MNKFEKILALATCAMPVVASGATLSVHTTVLCPGGKAEVSAYFEQASSSGQVVQSCKAIHLSNNPSAQEASAWQTSIASLQGLALTYRPAVSVSNGLMRQDGLDGQGRIRSSVWTSAQGQKLKSALFDDKGYILSFDKWVNQTTVPDTTKMTCGQVYESAFNIKLFNTATGNIDAETADVEFLADSETTYIFEQKLGLSKSAYAPGPLSIVQPSPTATVAVPVPSVSVKAVIASVPTAVSTQMPTVVPTVAVTAVPTAIFGSTQVPTTAPTAVVVSTQIPTAAPTTVPVPTLIPTLAHTVVPTVAPTAVPTVVPTQVPTPVPAAIVVPTQVPTVAPTQVPTVAPTLAPTLAPTAVVVPTQVPTLAPTIAPTAVPTAAPTLVPTAVPTVAPTALPRGASSPASSTAKK